MQPFDNPNWFASLPLSRLNMESDQSQFFSEQLKNPESYLAPLWRGDPLFMHGEVAFLTTAALGEFPKDAPIVILGTDKGRAYFGIDVSDSETPDRAPFGDLGEYVELREAASRVSRGDLAIIGHARWLLEWHRTHQFCAVCGGKSEMRNGGAKRQCTVCGAEHFPRTNPVSIVLAVHRDACLLGRGPHFPAAFLSALAGFVEPAETPEEAAKRELFEEAGVNLLNAQYIFSQPWPFTASLMMGFLAEAENRELNLDTNEIVEARWIEKQDLQALLAGEERDFMIPPKFTIARQLMEYWASA